MLPILLADPNSAINVWLNEHPLVLGAGIITFGIIFLLIGITNVKTGRTTTKYGQVVEGPWAKAQGYFFIVFAIGLLIFGIFKAFGGSINF